LCDCLLEPDLLQCTFPHDDDIPSHCLKFKVFLVVSFDIALNLIDPEFSICLWNNEIPTALMAMPETAVNKDSRTVFRQDHIWLAWHILYIQPEPETISMQLAPHMLLYARILATDTGHIQMTLVWCQDIRHYYSGIM
jgi:hypothetical protein